jgi:cell surface protein SprA
MKFLAFIIIFLKIFTFCYGQGVFDLRTSGAWHLASIPSNQPDLFPEGKLQNNLASGYNRAKLAWYVVDPSVFYRNTSVTPDHLLHDTAQLENHLVREIFTNEVYPDIIYENGIPTYSSVLNLAFYPNEKGPYNYDIDSCIYSDGIDSSGKLLSPEKRWSGIMRTISINPLTDSFIKFIGFWIMDPFVYKPNSTGGNFYIDIGNISEDIMKDGLLSFENSYLSSSQLSSVWGIIPEAPPDYPAFTDAESQDIGLDGLNIYGEQGYFQNYLISIKNKFGYNSIAYQLAYNDPSSDNFHYYRGNDYDNVQESILGRYKKYNDFDGNSINWGMSSTNQPDREDINRNGILDTTENYFQYKIELKPEKMVVGQNFITEKRTVIPKNGNGTPVTWYKFMVPLKSDQKEIIGNINNLSSSNFIRLFLNGFSDTVIVRFFEFDLTSKDLPYHHPTQSDCPDYIFPNPSDGIFQIDNINYTIKSIAIYDLLGHKTFELNQQNCPYYPYYPIIDASFLSKGIYIMEIETPESVCIQKILIEK